MSHHKPNPEDLFLTRREFLCRCEMGMGALALNNLLADVGDTRSGTGCLTLR
jgi:hypothetical protein